MNKNLLYYTVSIKDEYAQLLKKSIESIDISNEKQIDILIITDEEYYQKNLRTIERPNTNFFLIDKPNNFDEACFNKLKIWDYPNIDQYENILYLDSDILVNKNLELIFKKCVDENKLYVVAEDYNIPNHNRIHFSLGTYKQEDLVFFEKNKIYTFNAGTFMFKKSDSMSKHFNKVVELIENHKGPFFTDQSFMNYYFNSHKLSDTKSIVKDSDYKFVVNSNYSENLPYNDCIMHFITEGNNKDITLERMSNILSKMYLDYTREKNYLVEVTSVDYSISKVKYTSKFQGLLNIKLIEENVLIYENNIEVFENCGYWSTFNSSWYDREFIFTNGRKTQRFLIEGLSKKYQNNYFGSFLIEKNFDERTELCNLFDKFGSDKASRPNHGFLPGHNYSRFYFNLFKDIKEHYINLFELGLGTNKSDFMSSMGADGTPCASIRAWESFFQNAKIFGADIDKEILIDSERIKTFFCDQNNEKIIHEMWQNENLNVDFDIIIDDAVHNFDYNVKFLENSIHKLKVGGYFIIEDVNINSILSWYEYFENNKSKYGNYSYGFIKLKCNHNIHDNNLIVLKKKEGKKMNTISNKQIYSDRTLWIRDINKFIGKGKGVEIGVFKGEFSKEILKNWGGTLYMVDVWKALGNEYIDSSNHSYHSDAYKLTMDNIKGYEDRGIMIRASSKIASEMFDDESLDFIFIDANHAYEFVFEDINLWFPKLKKGGMFSGHDYILMDWYNDPNFLENKKDKHIYSFLTDGTPFYNGVFGVNPAVDEFCEKMGYKVNHTGEWFATWWFIK